MTEYRPTSQDEHGREEELQWARIVASDEPARGVALIFIQKLCTAFHEFEPACRAGYLNPDAVDHFRARLVARAKRVVEVLEKNGLAEIEGAAKLKQLLTMIETAKSLEALALLEEPIHALSHILSEGLDQS
jgi:hypothetical protein